MEDGNLTKEQEKILNEIGMERVKARGNWPVPTRQTAVVTFRRLLKAAQNGGLPPEHRVTRRYAEKVAELAGRKAHASKLTVEGVIKDPG